MSRPTYLARAGDILGRYGTFAALVILTLGFSLFVPRFATPSNLLTLLVQVSMLSIVAMGVTAVFVVGELDISTGNVVSLAGILVAVLLTRQVNALAAIGAAVGLGLLVGVANGLIVGFLKVPALLGTLGTSVIALGVNFWLGGGSSIMLFDEIAGPQFTFLGEGKLLGIPFPFAIALVVYAALWVLLSRTKWGLRMYAVGGNKDAAAVFGIDARWLKFAAFSLCGMVAAVSGVLLAARLGTGSPIGGNNYTLDAIAAVFIGVGMFREGEPHLIGTVLGVLIFGVLLNALSLLGVGYEVQSILRGVVILGAVGLAGGRAQLQIKLF